LRVEKLYNGGSIGSASAAFAVASLLALLALITLGIKTLLEWKTARAHEQAQRATVDDTELHFSSSEAHK
jgi:sulfate transport system permease protein